MTPPEWVTVVPSMAPFEARTAFDRWLVDHHMTEKERAEAVRIDLIRGSDGELARVLARGATLSERGWLDEPGNGA